jgi:hypothetical protein
MPAVVKTDRLTTRNAAHAIDEISLAVMRGEMFGFLGPIHAVRWLSALRYYGVADGRPLRRRPRRRGRRASGLGRGVP